MSQKKSDLGPRVLTALIAIPVLLFMIFFGPAWFFFIMVATAGSISTWEYCSVTYGDDFPAAKWVSSTLSAVAMSVVYFFPAYRLEGVIAAFCMVFMFFLFFYKDQEESSSQLCASVTGIVYGGLMLVPLALMRFHAQGAGPMWVVMALAIIWGSDTGAYFAGRAFGKHKLYEAVSPNKTIEGALGGVFASVIFTFGFNQLFVVVAQEVWVALSWWQVLLVAIPGSLLGQIGDLCESLIKRANGVKDSGTIIYGHGGMLDRIDALIFASPWFYYFVITFVLVPQK